MARIHFSKSNLDSLTFSPGDKSEGLKAIAVLTAQMTPENAELLKCGFVYEKNGNPREHIKSVPLDHTLRDIDLHLPSGTQGDVFEIFRPEKIFSLTIKRLDEFKYELSMRVHVFDRDHDLLDFAKSWMSRDFECAITTAQQEFDFAGGDPGGTAVDMGTGEKVTVEGPLFACENCEREVSLTPDGSGHILDGGEIVACTHQSARQVADSNGEDHAGPLPSMQQMSGRRKKKQPAPLVEDVEDLVTVN